MSLTVNDPTMTLLQLSTLLKPASMFNHNGTYLKGIGLKHKNVEIVVEAGPDFDSTLTGAHRQAIFGFLKVPQAQHSTSARIKCGKTGCVAHDDKTAFGKRVGVLNLHRHDTLLYSAAWRGMHIACLAYGLCSPGGNLCPCSKSLNYIICPVSVSLFVLTHPACCIINTLSCLTFCHLLYS